MSRLRVNRGQSYQTLYLGFIILYSELVRAEISKLFSLLWGNREIGNLFVVFERRHSNAIVYPIPYPIIESDPGLDWPNLDLELNIYIYKDSTLNVAYWHIFTILGWNSWDNFTFLDIEIKMFDGSWRSHFQISFNISI